MSVARHSHATGIRNQINPYCQNMDSTTVKIQKHDGVEPFPAFPSSYHHSVTFFRFRSITPAVSSYVVAYGLFRFVLVLTDIDTHRSPDTHSFMIYNPLLQCLEYKCNEICYRRAFYPAFCGYSPQPRVTFHQGPLRALPSGGTASWADYISTVSQPWSSPPTRCR